VYGFYRVASAINRTSIANPIQNGDNILSLLKEAYSREVSLVVFPELTLTGYTSSDLFFNQLLLRRQEEGLKYILEGSRDISTLAVIGMAILERNRLYSCGVVIQFGKILGVVPKIYLPNREEFYERRHFNSGKDILGRELKLLGNSVPFGVDLLFSRGELTFGVEICEDLWSVTPPSFSMASGGANLICNLSASNELIGKAEYREELVRTQSARGICAYVYSSAGVGESTTDTLFGGDGIISEYGTTLARAKRFSMQNSLVVADVDIGKLNQLRLRDTSFSDTEMGEFRTVQFEELPKISKLQRYINPTPFVPSESQEKSHRCEEITDIQAYALIKRMSHAKIAKAVIGISGGLDSTLALLSTHKAFEIMGWDSKNILAITMAGFGTTSRTKNNAIELCRALGVTLRDIDIRDIALKEFELIGHSRDDLSVTYENVQARARTSILMNVANREGGLVIGTGDLSEIALGWSTYNGDHMSMYGLNSGIPKTLIRYVIEYYKYNKAIAHTIDDILDTPISPELLPHQDGKIAQKTEDIIGSYELHDFFLYHFLKYGAEPQKLLFLANLAFSGKYSPDEVRATLRKFIWRFFTQQFKRSCMPDGVKVGTVSLSPRADWRMPSDADVSIWLEELNSK
jgi:NAD+ synthase (glutamine-hydrolysing)